MFLGVVLFVSLSSQEADTIESERPLLALILHCSQPGASSDAVCPDACRRWPQYCYYAIAAENGVPGTCKLPPYPSVGEYSIEAIELARTGRLADFTLHYSCPPGYELNGYHPSCVSGTWNADFPSCVSGVADKPRGNEAGGDREETGQGSRSRDDDKSCLTEENVAGECVLYYQCGANGTIINDGVQLIDIRSRRRRRRRRSIFTGAPTPAMYPSTLTSNTRVNGECESYLDTCCLLPDRKSPGDTVTPAPPAKNRDGCGWRNPDGIGVRITGAADGKANFGEFPWMVVIITVTTKPLKEIEPDGQKLNLFLCGGSLIHPSVVLTAAQRVSSGKQLRVRAGEWDVKTKKEIYPYQDRDVKEVVVHKDFNKGNLFYDIGLLFLESPVEPAPNVGVACLPNVGVRASAGLRCQVTGWGKDRFGEEGRYQGILKRVEVPVVDRARCQQELRKTRLGKYFQLHRSFMCAGGEAGVDTCKGDGGSPLVCPSEYERDRYIQHGIVSWGINCGEQAPGVYVEVGYLRSWVDDKVRARGYDEKVYTYID